MMKHNHNQKKCKKKRNKLPPKRQAERHHPLACWRDFKQELTPCVFIVWKGKILFLCSVKMYLTSKIISMLHRSYSAPV